MHDTDTIRQEDRRSRIQRGTAIRAAALSVAALVVCGCGQPCRDDDPGRVAAFEAAWRGDTQKMRGLLADNRALANVRACPPRRNLASWMIAWSAGEGTTSVLHVAARQGHAEFVKLLLASGAEVNARDGFVNAPLHLAAQYGHDEVVGLLLAANADVNSRRNGGLTPLHLAAEYGRFPVVKRLLAAGAHVTDREGGGWTPLHRAASEGHENVVRLLLSHGADSQALDEQGAPPRAYAVLNRHRAVVELLTPDRIPGSGEEKGTSALALAAREGDAEDVRLLLSRGADVDGRDKNGLTPLQLAINRSPGGDTRWEEERSAEERTVVELLLTAGARIEVQGRDGNRPLHTAVLLGRSDVAELLLARGAEVNARNDWGWTPLHFAANRHHAGLVDLLLKHGADADARNNGGHTPLNEVFGDKRIEAALKRHHARE